MVRKPSLGSTTTGRNAGSVTPASVSAVRICPSLSSIWATRSMCCHWHAPHPFATSGHGGSTRIGDGSSTSRARACTMPRRCASAFASTRSPGMTPGSDTVRPSASAPDRGAVRAEPVGDELEGVAQPKGWSELATTQVLKYWLFAP